MNYRKVNNLFGWITGAIAFIVYLKTMEPTVSFWDCGEFLSCAYKLEVGHSPGAPFFMLLQRMFGILAGGTTGQPSASAAMYINAFSALTSALTILFLFWSITHMAKKLVAEGNVPDNKQIPLIIGAGLIGGLAYTFSDTFWFSAVEAEVYGTSSFFTAITFWAILKWENVADNKHADRWLLLISYLIGLSVCVHLLNLLTIPAVGMVYYFRRYKATPMGTLTAFLISCIILAFVQFGIIQYIPIIASKLDILFTNSFGLPFDAGSITFLVLLCGILIWALMFAKRKGKYLLHTGILCIMFIVIGYSSYIVPVIRSRADVPIDMTNPDNALSLKSYVSREQFGEQPLLFGQDFDTQPIGYDSKGPVYSQTKKDGKDFYEVVGEKREPKYDPATLRFFPRVYENNDPSHAQFYRNYLGLAQGESPTSADNFKFFFRYQMGWMWWRYFMWNYAGRQNDLEGQGEPKNGNWISGIKPIDKWMGLGDIDQMADGYKNNPARNQLYFLPFILGLLGLVFQFNRNRKDGFVTLTLFFFTGAAIGIYLNMNPLQPRERDYAFAGCTYAYAIWIGLGVLMVHKWFQRATKGSLATYGAIALCLLLVPALMAKEEWNDHDRSSKTLARATAYNTLMSCAPNAILFTFGDNDTYPVWYLQEIEHIRSDVRVINMSLLGIDWYIDQLNYRVNDADAVPMLWKKADYVGDRHNYIQYNASNPLIQQDKYYNLVELCDFFVNPIRQSQTSNGEMSNYLPTKKMYVNSLSKADLVKNGLVNAADTANIINEVKYTYPKNLATKDDLAAMNIIAAVARDGWKRPIYFDGGLPGDNYEGLNEYMKLEGIVYRLVPYKFADSGKQPSQEQGFSDLDKSYDLMMNKYIWGGANTKNVYFDEKNRIMFASYRMNAGRFATELAAKGRKDEAVKLLDHVLQGITEHSYFYDFTAYYMATAYYRAGALAKGKDLTLMLTRNCEDDIKWVMSLDDNGRQSEANDVQRDLSLMYIMGNTAIAAGDTTTGRMLQQKVETTNKQVGYLFGNGQQQQQQQ
ncbi:MAG: DUF2723 domain-containing protein [Taibaiella sp.]|nr:DUF2723 domain-containing protein [Taibaiella sp.]